MPSVSRGIVPEVQSSAGTERRKTCILAGGAFAGGIEPEFQIALYWKLRISPRLDSFQMTRHRERKAKQGEESRRMLHQKRVSTLQYFCRIRNVTSDVVLLSPFVVPASS